MLLSKGERRMFQSPATLNNVCSPPTYAESLLLHKGFSFQQRRDALDLRGLSKVDTDKIERDADVDALQSYVENITFANVTEEDFSLYSDDTFVKLFRLSQLSTEHLIYNQDCLVANVNALAKKYSAKKREMTALRSENKEKDAEISRLREEALTSKRAVAAYESMLRFPPVPPPFVQPNPSTPTPEKVTPSPASALQPEQQQQQQHQENAQSHQGTLTDGRDPESEMRDFDISKGLEDMIRREVRQEVSLLVNRIEKTEFQAVEENPSAEQQREKDGNDESPRTDDLVESSAASSGASGTRSLDVSDELQSEKEASNSSASTASSVPIPAEGEEHPAGGAAEKETKFPPKRMTMNTTGVSTLTPEKFEEDSLASAAGRKRADPLHSKATYSLLERRFDFGDVISSSSDAEPGSVSSKPHADDQTDDDVSPGIDLSSYDSIEDAHYRKKRRPSMIKVLTKKVRLFSRRRRN